MVVSGQLHASVALPPGETAPGAHCIRGWMGPRVGLQKSLAHAESQTLVVQPVTRRYTDWAALGYYIL
jgi:hypothetical protein